MDLRFCARCAAEVEDVGGFCLLGHPLRLDPLIPSVADWRDEIGRACDEARVETAGPTAAAEDRPPRDAAQPPPPPPAESARSGRSVWRSLDDDGAAVSGDPIQAFAPPARMDWGPQRSRFLVRPLGRRQPPAHA
jgi:hypothetical protein